MASCASRSRRLNAPFGARCFLTPDKDNLRGEYGIIGLNAPFGARCFLTEFGERYGYTFEHEGLNAPFGARCFLTTEKGPRP